VPRRTAPSTPAEAAAPRPLPQRPEPTRCLRHSQRVQPQNVKPGGAVLWWRVRVRHEERRVGRGGAHSQPRGVQSDELLHFPGCQVFEHWLEAAVGGAPGYLNISLVRFYYKEKERVSAKVCRVYQCGF